jgi:hypothetical protein
MTTLSLVEMADRKDEASLSIVDVVARLKLTA